MPGNSGTNQLALAEIARRVWTIGWYCSPVAKHRGGLTLDLLDRIRKIVLAGPRPRGARASSRYHFPGSTARGRDELDVVVEVDPHRDQRPSS
jgi:hypothetical protein